MFILNSESATVSNVLGPEFITLIRFFLTISGLVVSGFQLGSGPLQFITALIALIEFYRDQIKYFCCIDCLT